MNAFRTGWYLIYTRPRHERKVHDHLTDRKINTILPTRKIFRTWHDRIKCVSEPLFPSYVFIYLNDMQSYYEGIDAEGALYYVRTGKEIARVSDAVVANIKLVTDVVRDIEVSDDRFQPGQRLFIKEGALTGLACEVVQLNGRQKALVRVDLLRRNLLINLPTESLAVI